MTPSSDLYYLIHSLSTIEKKFFSQHTAHPHQSTPKYLWLFKQINLQEVFDDEEIKTRFENQFQNTHYANSKNYLYKLILKVMREFHAEKTIEREVQNLIRDASFLLNKKLFKPCKKILRKAQKMAELYELFPELRSILRLQRKITRDTGTKNVWENTQELIRYEQETVDKIVNQLEYETYRDQLFLMVTRRGWAQTEDQRKEAEKVCQLPLLQDERLACSFEAKRSFYSIHNFYYMISGEVEKGMKFQKKRIELYQQEPHFIDLERSHYNSTLINYLSHCFQMDQFEEFPPILKGLKQQTKAFKKNDNPILLYTQYYDFVYRFSTCQFEGIEESIAKCDRLLQTIDPRLTLQIKSSYGVILCDHYFILEQYDKAYSALQKIFTDEKNEIREDSKMASHFLELVVLYELGRFNALELCLQRIKRAIKQGYQPSAFDAMLMDGIKKLVYVRNSSELAEVFKKMHQWVEKDKIQHPQEFEPDQIVIELWIESHVTGIPVKEIKKKRYQEKVAENVEMTNLQSNG